MVDRIQREKAAEDPRAYGTFTEWLQDAVSKDGAYPAQLAKFLGHKDGGQNVYGWQNGKVPKLPTVGLIAEWAGVDPAQLKLLAMRQIEHREQQERLERRDTALLPKRMAPAKRLPGATKTRLPKPAP